MPFHRHGATRPCPCRRDRGPGRCPSRKNSSGCGGRIRGRVALFPFRDFSAADQGLGDLLDGYPEPAPAGGEPGGLGPQLRRKIYPASSTLFGSVGTMAQEKKKSFTKRSLPADVKLAVETSQAKKAVGLCVLALSELSSFTDYFLVMHGNSSRQNAAIADGIEGELRKAGVRPL